jgi:hypothetical protein
MLDDPGRVRSQITSVLYSLVCQIQRFDLIGSDAKSIYAHYVYGGYTLRFSDGPYEYNL